MAAPTNVVSSGTATNWNISFDDDDLAITINIQTNGLNGSNLVFFLKFYVNDEETLDVTVPGVHFGSGTFDSYLNIGGYTVFLPLQGNEIGKNGVPRLEAERDDLIWTEVGRQNPTCEDDGYISFTSNRGTRRTDVIPALGHDMGEWFEFTVPTCTTDGLERRDCLRTGCNHFETKAIQKLDHTPDGGT